MDPQQEHVRPVTRGLKPDEASRLLANEFGISCQPTTLMKLRHTGGGPVFYKAGRFPLYAETDVRAWAATKISPRVASTSELAT